MCSAGDLVSLRNVEVYVLVRAVISRVDSYMLRLFRGGGGGGAGWQRAFNLNSYKKCRVSM